MRNSISKFIDNVTKLTFSRRGADYLDAVHPPRPDTVVFHDGSHYGRGESVLQTKQRIFARMVVVANFYRSYVGLLRLGEVCGLVCRFLGGIDDGFGFVDYIGRYEQTGGEYYKIYPDMGFLSFHIDI